MPGDHRSNHTDPPPGNAGQMHIIKRLAPMRGIQADVIPPRCRHLLGTARHAVCHITANSTHGQLLWPLWPIPSYYYPLWGIGDDLHLWPFQPSSAFQLSYFNENFILALYEAIFPSSSSLTSNSVTSPILRFQRDSHAVSTAFLAASSQLVGDDPTSSMTL